MAWGESRGGLEFGFSSDSVLFGISSSKTGRGEEFRSTSDLSLSCPRPLDQLPSALLNGPARLPRLLLPLTGGFTRSHPCPAPGNNGCRWVGSASLPLPPQPVSSRYRHSLDGNILVVLFIRRFRLPPQKRGREPRSPTRRSAISGSIDFRAIPMVFRSSSHPTDSGSQRHQRYAGHPC